MKQEAPGSLYSCMRSFIVYFKQNKMSDMEKSYSFHSVTVPANHISIECFINKGCTTRKPAIVLYIDVPNVNISNVTRAVADRVMTL